ncbi:ATP-binding protein [Vibrio sp. M260118]|uniref:ATP-binding protein n=1 Tax=Vibrio sp. M260118 TaxID=3020896 RepID=UPI002F41F679
MRISTISQSLAFRTSVFLLGVILVAQLLSGMIWYQHASERDKQGLTNTVKSLALSASSTISFFQTLPSEYRHLVLNQLRNMGGTRFFVSLNNHRIDVPPLAQSTTKTLVVDQVKQILSSELQGAPTIDVEFTERENLRVFNNELPIDELPLLWAHYSLSFGDLDPPILVMQVEVADNEWFYLAAVLPAPYVNLETSYFEFREWITLCFSALLLLVCTWFIVRREIQPIKDLAKAATLMSSRLNIPTVKEKGSRELKAAVRAFNKMNRRIDSHMNDREMLFSAISHDLKTPIACLKLRSEMLDNPTDRERFTRLANDLDLMVKGALQCIKETDIHEEIEPINLNEIIQHIISTLPQQSENISLVGSIEQPLAGKPLAIKRCIQNLVDNALKYGDRAQITLVDTEEGVEIRIDDFGQGIDTELLDKLFQPYFRANTIQDGTGLGLTISQSIAKAHGGTLNLSHSQYGGLCATLSFPRDSL